MARQSLLIEATKDDIFEVLCDYGNYADWAADVADSTVLDREGDLVVAEFFSPELMSEKYTLEFIHSRPMSIIYTQIDYYRGGLRGSWHIEDVAESRDVIVTAEMKLKTSLWRSFANHRKANLILNRRLSALQQVFGVSSTTPEGLPVTGGGLLHGKGVLETIQVEEEFAVSLFGHKYLVKKADASTKD